MTDDRVYAATRTPLTASDDAGVYYAALLDPDGNNVEAVVREF
jgi:hypothetical protein